MAKTSKQNRELLVRDVKTRITEAQFQRLQELIGQSRFKNMSELLRAIIGKQPITIYTKDGTLGTVMEELIQLRRELSAIGNNLNQVTKQINSLRGQAGKGVLILQAAATLSEVEAKIEKLYPLISQLAHKWLQE